MRSAILLALGVLGACTTARPMVHGETPGHTCNAAGAENFIGQSGNSETGAAIMRATHAAVLRWAPPGYMLTMDYRADRVTVRLDEARKILSINCG